jgi:cyclophilin family peptidyl-prolyl cis-trans isomerase
MAVKLNTNVGALMINLYHKETPRTSRNFIELAKHGE